MSTRAHLIVTDKKQTCYVYHHCDGYPEGVGEDLKQFMNENIYNSNILYPDKFCKELEAWDSQFEYENTGIHGDEEYIYRINISGNKITINCEAVRYSDPNICEMFPAEYIIGDKAESISLAGTQTKYEQLKLINDILSKLNTVVYDCEELSMIIDSKLTDTLTNIKEAVISGTSNTIKIKDSVFRDKN